MCKLERNSVSQFRLLEDLTQVAPKFFLLNGFLKVSETLDKSLNEQRVLQK